MKKTQVMFLSTKGQNKELENAKLVHQGVSLEVESNLKFLGVTVDQELNWKEHVVGIRKRCLASLAQLKRIFPSLPIKTRIMLYNVLVLPHLDYCSCIWNSCGVDGRNKIERVQNYAMRLIMSAEPRTPSAELRSKLSWMTLQNRRNMQVISKVHRCLQNKAPHYLCSKFESNLNAKYRGTRGSANVQLQRPRTNFYRNSFEFNGAYQWNSLPTYLKSISSYTAFRKALHKHVLQSS